MIIQNLKLRNYRNYENLSAEFSPGINVITGENAQGKTNLLESMIYLSLTRSHRIANEKKLIAENQPFAEISCSFSDEKEEKKLRAIIHPNGKSLFVNDYAVKKSSEFIGLLNVVLFAPDDLYLFNDQPRERRRLMNQEITKICPSYLISLNAYQNLLKERNIYLKRDRIDNMYLDTLDEKMAEEEEGILKQRQKFIDYINERITDLYQKLAMDDIKVHINYKTCLEGEINRDRIVEMHRKTRQKDTDYHMTTAGIHREDMVFEIEDRNLIQLASQGQKRMVMLAFKMALMEYIQSVTGKKPVFLLDDVLSELDEQRQKNLFEMIREPYQCFITSTEVPAFIRNRQFSEYQIHDGRITDIRGGRL